jgi:hypothetical protein
LVKCFVWLRSTQALRRVIRLVQKAGARLVGVDKFGAGEREKWEFCATGFDHQPSKSGVSEDET